jgi:SM-20-related protein
VTAYAGLAAELIAAGLVIVDDFVTVPRVRALRACAVLRRDRGDFRGARIGAAKRLQRREDIRGDSVCWIAAPLCPEEEALLGDFEAVRLAINRAGLMGLFDLELHHAWYPPGAGYARHLDQLQRRDHRRVSLILYLNESWGAEDGGQLRIFDGAGGHRDVEPVAGRLVCFLSAGCEHAVLPTRRDRWSITGWYRHRA